MDESEFQRLADAWLTAAADALEGEKSLDVELQAGILTIETESGKTLIVNKHAPSRQLWLASPLSGGLHFSYHAGKWGLADGRELGAVLAKDLETMAGIEIVL